MVIGLVLILFGIVAITCRKALIRDRAAWQKDNFGIKYSPFDFKYGEVLGIIIGTALVVIGTLTMLGIIEFQ
jgi:hypothetical protein